MQPNAQRTFPHEPLNTIRANAMNASRLFSLGCATAGSAFVECVYLKNLVERPARTNFTRLLTASCNLQYMSTVCIPVPFGIQPTCIYRLIYHKIYTFLFCVPEGNLDREKSLLRQSASTECICDGEDCEPPKGDAHKVCRRMRV